MTNALSSTSDEINIGHAGTAMRFLTAYFSVKELIHLFILTGSHRMKERPIKILVEALKAGWEQTLIYVENEGFPPLKITGKKLVKRFC